MNTWVFYCWAVPLLLALFHHVAVASEPPSPQARAAPFFGDVASGGTKNTKKTDATSVLIQLADHRQAERLKFIRLYHFQKNDLHNMREFHRGN